MNPTGGSVTIQFSLTKGATTYSLGSAAVTAGSIVATSLGAILEPGGQPQHSAHSYTWTCKRSSSCRYVVQLAA
jgi:hypothetical protein